MRLFDVLVFFAVVPVPGLALASEWNESFASPDLAAAVTPCTRLAVVGVGDGVAAAAALRAALSNLDRVSTVIDQQSVGDAATLTALDDRAILQRAAGLPVDAVAIVRIHSRRRHVLEALVTLYRPGGVILRSFTVDEGVRMTLPMLTFEPRPSPPLEQFNDQKLSVNESFSLFFGPGSDLVYTHGSYQIPLSGAEFFARVGRPDLATRWSHRRRGRQALMALGGMLIGGGVAALAAGVVVYARSFCGAGTKEPCTGPNLGAFTGGLLGGMAGIGGGIVTIVGARRWRIAPVSVGEARQLGDKHNDALRRRLGIDEVSVAPSVSPTFTGATLGLRY